MADYPVQGPSRKPDEDMLSKISNLARKVSEYLVPSDSTFGFKADPKAMGKPNESIPAYMGRRIGEAFTDTVQPMTSAIATAVPIAKEFVSNLTGNTAPATAPTPPPTQKPNTVGLPVGNSGFTVTGANTSGRPSYTTRTYYDPNGNVVASGLSGATSRGGFVGASTDAEAARNLQDRFAQDQAASAMAANYNRQAEALKDLRAAQMGIPRSALESSANTQPDVQTRNPFSLPGDSFGDAEIRKNNMMSAINDPQATKSQRAAALETMKSFIEGNQPPPLPARAVVNPVEEQRFLLAQQQANRQQVNDENRLKVDMANLQNNQAKTALEQKQYEDKTRADFMANTLFTAPNAPTSQLAATAWEISKVTGVPPDVVASIADEEAKQYDWKNGPPKDMKAFNERIAAKVTAKYKGGQ